jgi:putative transcriptional regulator
MINEEHVQTPHAIAEILGTRLKQARLNQNLTQNDVAEQIGLTRKAIMNAEKGQVSVQHFVAILQTLGLTSQLDLFLPERPISPIQLLKLQGKKRQRASISKHEQSNISKQPPNESPEW